MTRNDGHTMFYPDKKHDEHAIDPLLEGLDNSRVDCALID